MKRLLLVAALGVLALPPATAQNAPILHLGVYEIEGVSNMQGHTIVAMSANFPNATQFQFWVTEGAVPTARTTRAIRETSFVRAEGEFDVWRVNGTVGPGESVLVEYRVGDDSVKVKLPLGAPTLVALAQPLSGRVPTSDLLTFAPAKEGFWTAQLASPRANQTLTVAFTGQPTAPQTGGRVPDGATPTTDQTRWVWGVGGVALGLLGFWVAVQQGWVSAPGKATRFVKGGAMESNATLETRRRTLMAALKELEHGHDAKEVPDDVYFPLKEEYKQQAVRVMRTLEEKRER